MAYEYTEQYDFLSGDIYNIFNHAKDLSVNGLVPGSNNYNNVLSLWNNATTGINNISNWETLCQTLNITLRNYFINSGEFYGYNSTSMDDSEMYILVSPASYTNSGSVQLRIHFVPCISCVVNCVEYNNQAGLFKTITNNFYMYNSSGQAVSTSVFSYSNAPVVTLLINTNGTWQVGYRDSNLFSGFANVGDFYQYASSPSVEGNWLFNKSVLCTYRNVYYPPQSSVNYLPYGSSVYLTKYMENRYDLGNQTFGSGDYVAPTPTPATSGESGEIDLTETNSLLGGIIESLTSEVSSGDFPTYTSGEIVDSIGLPAIDDVTDNFWWALMNGLRVALLSESGEVYTTYFHEEPFVLNARSFIPPLNLKEFFFIGFLLGYVLTEYKLVRRIVIKWQAGEFYEVSRFFYHQDISKYL